MAEIHVAPTDRQEFIGLPLVASVFGKKKLNISPFKVGIMADVEILQMLGPSRRDDIHLGLARRLKSFIANISRQIEAGGTYQSFAPVLEAICRAYNPGWLLLARWHMEERSPQGYAHAKRNCDGSWRTGRLMLRPPRLGVCSGHACYRTGTHLEKSTPSLNVRSLCMLIFPTQLTGSTCSCVTTASK